MVPILSLYKLPVRNFFAFLKHGAAPYYPKLRVVGGGV